MAKAKTTSSSRAHTRKAAVVHESFPVYGRLLIDTHVWLWIRGDDKRLGTRTRRLLESGSSIWLSAASALEIAIKTASGKLKIPRDVVLEDEVGHLGMHVLPVTFAHAEILRTMPRLHGDPFDRILAAQVLAEGMTLVTGDDVLLDYGIPSLDARL